MNRKITYYEHRQFSKLTERERYDRLPGKPNPEFMTFQEIINYIKCGQWKGIIEQLRGLYDTDYPLYKDLKQYLPVIQFSCVSNGQSLSEVISPTNLVVIDFDKIPDLPTLRFIRNEIQTDAYTRCLFESPSGKGFKVIVEVDNDQDNITHHGYYNALKDYYQLTKSKVFQYWDASGSDITRLCFISYDRNLYLNPNSRVWTVQNQQNTPYKRTGAAQPFSSSGLSQQTVTGMGSEEVLKIIRFLEGNWNKALPMTAGNRHDSTFKRAKEMSEWGIPISLAKRYFEPFIRESDTPEDLWKQIENGYAKSNFGSKYRKL